MSFTWSCGNLHQRLDRCLANPQWIASFSHGFMQHIDKIGSDHRPLLLHLNDNVGDVSARPCRFIGAWQDHLQLMGFLESVWQTDLSLQNNINNFQSEVQGWNQDVFGHIDRWKRCVLAQLCGIDKALLRGHSEFLKQLVKELRDELDVVLEQEESL
ncbi:hypothetical protein V6N11_034357 [Hibiscus sabdariffa]|uniref:Uncharacterized protein n=2 Tax=Hibiscus sabdariffa TaxID=183260 RepID=A0ABR2DUX7_9ROSI